MRVNNFFLSNYGVNKSSLLCTFNKLGLNNRLILIELKKRKLENISKSLNKMKLIGKKLEKKVENYIHFYKKIKNYTGLKHKINLPCQGQRTKTDAKTNKTGTREKIKKKN